MKKKQFLLVAMLIIAVLLLANVFAACDEEETEPAPVEVELSFEQVYAYAQDAGYTGTLEELIAAFKGDSAYQIAVKNGYNGSEMQWLNSLVGATGNDGTTPHIGENGNWYVGRTDTGVCARGQNGADGKDGVGIEKTEINSDGEFVVTYTDGTTENLGKINAHPHDIAEEELVIKESTCQGKGIKNIYCGTCGEVIKTIITPIVEHSYEDIVTAPTATENGTYYKKCKCCGCVTDETEYNLTFTLKK